MKFTTVEPNLSIEQINKATKKFTSLILELGVRKNNPYVGSGLGGDNFKLLVLMSLPHTLVCNSHTIIVCPNGIRWGSKLLVNCSMRSIRLALDDVFPFIKEQHKYVALAMESLTKPESFKEAYWQNAGSFPKVDKAMEEGKFTNVQALAPNEQLIVAYLLCISLAEQLDCGDTSNIQNVGRILGKFAPEIALMSIRKFIQIDRLVNHNLDEDPVFEPVITRINNAILDS